MTKGCRNPSFKAPRSHNHKTSQTSFFATSFTKEILQKKRDYLEFFHQWGFKANGKILRKL